ncbi:hypothetical protein K0U07_02225 [bacterium]|nr:hypothetical protein [bacterium]
MNKNLRRLLSLSVLAACTFAPAYAYDNKEDHKHNMQHAVPPGQYPGGDESLDFFVGASYTYWVPYQTGMVIGQGRTSSASQGNTAAPSTDGASGFKVMLGANTQHDAWNVQLEYTWFYRSPGFSTNKLKNTVHFTPTFDELTPRYSSLESRFQNQFNRIDGMVDRSFYAGHYLAFRPWLGLLGAFDYQDLDYNATTTEGTDLRARFHQDWWGIGPYAGAEATFYFTNDWGLFISTGASLLLSNHDVRQRLGTWDGTTLSPTIINNSDNFNNVEPMVEAKLGLRWDSNWTDWALRIDVAWELQTYFNHNGFLPYYSPVGVNGDYSMQGLTVGVRVNF